MPKNIKVFRDNATNNIYTETPYKTEFVEAARRMQGHWDKDTSMWRFDITCLRELMSVISRVYDMEEPIITRFDAPAQQIGKFEVEIKKEAPDWRDLNNPELLDLYLAIEQELRRRKL